jgi:hypothetical protein
MNIWRITVTWTDSEGASQPVLYTASDANALGEIINTLQTQVVSNISNSPGSTLMLNASCVGPYRDTEGI